LFCFPQSLATRKINVQTLAQKRTAMEKDTHTARYEPNTSVLFLNHASILLKKGDRYLLTDPWHQRPSFGSWLPTFTQYIHPTYTAALGKKLSILISHGSKLTATMAAERLA
jgi:hypothetical protein